MRVLPKSKSSTIDLFQKNEQIKQDRIKAIDYLNTLFGIEIKELDKELQDGVLLCNLINQLKPGTIKQVGYKDLSFIKMDNIIRFLQGAEQLGLEKADLFDTLDLFEGRKMEAVVHTILTLSELTPAQINAQGRFPLPANDLCVIRRHTKRVQETSVVYVKEGVTTHYQLGNCIGQGPDGAVFRALDLATGETVAIKRWAVSESRQALILKDAERFKHLNHPNLILFLGYVQTQQALYLILEYAENGSLLATLTLFGPFPERLVASFALKLVHALDYLHQHALVHGNLKPANILTTKTGDVKLTDVCFDPDRHSVRFDLWCLGCTLTELLTGHALLDSLVFPQIPPCPDQASETMQAFLSLCFDSDSAGLLKTHPWLDPTLSEPEEIINRESQLTLLNDTQDIHFLEDKSSLKTTWKQDPETCLEKKPLFSQLNRTDLDRIEHYIQTLGLTLQEQHALSANQALLSHALSLQPNEPVKTKGLKGRKKKEECVIS